VIDQIISSDLFQSDDWRYMEPLELVQKIVDMYESLNAPAPSRASIMESLEARVIAKNPPKPRKLRLGDYRPPRKHVSDNSQVLAYFCGMYCDTYGDYPEGCSERSFGVKELSLVKNFLKWTGSRKKGLEIVEFLFQNLDRFLLNIGKSKLSVYHLGTKEIVSSLIAWHDMGVWQQAKKNVPVKVSSRCETSGGEWTPLQPNGL